MTVLTKREKVQAAMDAKEKYRKEHPHPLYTHSGCKVGWCVFATEEEAKVAAKNARENGIRKAERGYDFGYCEPGSIEEVTVYKVCVP
jgi:hypothetical protein